MFFVGQQTKLKLRTRVDGEDVSPGSLTLTIKVNASSYTHTMTYPGDIILDAVKPGHFTAYFTPTVTGRHVFDWVGTAPAAGYGHGEFDVQPKKTG